MRKSLLLFAALFTTVAASAQITITSADFATPGNTALQAVDSMPVMTIGSGGANKTWNYTSLAVDGVDTMDFVLPSATPYGAQFPSSNLAVYMHGASGQGILYIINNSSNLALDGLNVMGSTANVNPNEVVTTFPATFGTSVSGTSQYTITIPFTAAPGYDSLKIKQIINKTGSFDAWGSLTLPLGSYNTIRLNETRRQTDSLWVHTTGPIPPAGWYFAQESKDTIYRYSWFANGAGYTLLEVDSSFTEGISQAKFLMIPVGPTAIHEVNADRSLAAFPNPAADMITINYEGKNELMRIFDATGKLVESVMLQNGSNKIDVQAYRAGIYFFSVGDKKGKFTVAK